MAVLKTYTFDQLVAQQATAVQGNGTALVDFSVGSIPRVFAQAFAAIIMWLQGLILQLLTVTRAATSAGTDLDTWAADYSFARLSATAATGTVTMARYTSTAAATIAPGAIVQTADGRVQFKVVADTAQAAYSATLGVYVIPAGTSSASVTVVCLTGGTAGNVAIGAINTLGQSLSGIDTVTNAAAFSNGLAAETDAAFRARFVVYLASLSKATKYAIGSAISNLSAAYTYSITENYDYAGNYKPGYFYVVLNDGSGSPSANTINAVTMAVDAVRAAGIQFNVFGPVVVTATVTVTVGIAAGYTGTAVRAAVATAVTAYINTLIMGQTLSWTKLIQVIYESTAGVASVSNLLINGAAVDITATAKQVISAGSVTVS